MSSPVSPNGKPVAAKTPMKNIENVYNKTPISTLQEYCQKLGKTPQYDLTATEGRAHQPQFVFTCRVGDVFASGQGGSKKTAKHAAAEAVLKVLTEDLVPKGNPPACQDLQIVATHHEVQKADETNPVGSLQELVVARGWRLPEYDLAIENGPAHKKEFVIRCTVENMQQFGTGSAKKHAKRLAAMNMYNFIINLPPDAKENVTSSSREAKSKTQFHELQNSESEDIAIDEETEKVDDPRDQLELIGKKSSFEVIYHFIHTQTKLNQFQCFVQLTTKPPVVREGVGATMEEANKSGARSCIEHLKIFAPVASSSS